MFTQAEHCFFLTLISLSFVFYTPTVRYNKLTTIREVTEMKKFVSYDKMSKKDKNKANSAKRKMWSDYGCLSPVSKVISNKKKETEKKMCRKNVFSAE